MFDPKSLIEMMMKGAAPQAQASQQGGQQGGLGGLGDLLGKMMQGGQQAPQQGGGGGLADILGKLGQAGGGQGGQASSQGGGLADILGKMMGGAQSGAPQQGQAPAQGGGMVGLEDLLRKAQAQMGGAGQGAQGGQGGGLMDILGQVLGQATSGVKDGARRVDDMTGASGHMRDATKSATGQSPEDLMAQLKDWVANNQGAAAAGAGGLGAVVLGTKTGRSMAARAAKIGGLALIGGLAYKALQNYQAGRPLLTGADPALVPAPQGSGFDVGAVTSESATLYIRAMIAAAAADGRIDEAEQQKILGSLKQVGLDAGAEEFLANELNNPATAADLAAGVRTQEEAVQVFTAARISVDLDNEEEHAFLVDLATRLGLDGKLAQHIDAAARGAA
ncbi:MAG: tellurite resistance TerB family protein [Hyphomicrobiaceae bacterium]|nr:tellurite resistance TerB family protein [Hyphomicrobiaceae bacterium]